MDKKRRPVLLGQAQELPRWHNINPAGDKAPPSVSEVMEWQARVYKDSGIMPDSIKYWDAGKLIECTIEEYVRRASADG